MKRALISSALCAALFFALATAACTPPGISSASTATSLASQTPSPTSTSSPASSWPQAIVRRIEETAALLWPRAFKPASHGGWAGASAAKPLVKITTTLPTVTTPPPWGDKFSGVINGVRTNRRVIALTFDDGPTAHTRDIVDTLNAFGDHATFFWVGSQITTDAAKYSIANGEELANHTWNHPNMWKLSSAEASAEIGLTSARIAQFTGKPPTWFRSPFNRLFPKEFAQIKAHRLLYANYNVTSIDWMAGVSDAEVLDKLNVSLTPGGIVLMHDSPGHDPTQLLPKALNLFHSRGYQVVTLSQLALQGSPVNEPLTLGIQGLGY